jgi:2-deoxy-scyllo-inosamine dehydrogenase (SAM-dependent)
VLTPDDLVITNRGGMMFENGDPLTSPCHAPAEMLVVTVEGDVLLCYEDAQREHVFGNIMESPLEAIWADERLVRIRELLAAGRRSQAGAMCAACSNRAHVRPGQSVTEAWQPAGSA